MREPINPNNALKGLHTSYIATTGGGKSQAVLQMGLIPRVNPSSKPGTFVRPCRGLSHPIGAQSAPVL